MAKKFKNKYGKTIYYDLSEAEATILCLLNPGGRVKVKGHGAGYAFVNTERAEKVLARLHSGEVSPKTVAHEIMERKL